MTLGRGQFGQVLVRQCGIDVSVELRSPEGRLLARRDETYSFGPETLSLVSEVSGTYRLEVTANRAAATPGRYEVRLDELRPFLPRYRKRVAAETATSLALSLREQSDPSARRRAREGLEGAVRMWRKLGDSRGEAFTLNALAWEERLAGNMPRALELALRALSLARKSGDRQLEGRVLTATGLLQALVGDPKGALEAEAHALPLVRSEGDQDAEAASLRYSGLAAWMMGDFQRALDWSNEALAVARQIQNGTEEAWSLFGIATAYWGMADYSSALRYYELALPLFQIVGDREGEMLAVNALGGTYISVGAPRRTLLLEQPALETIRSLGDRAEEAMALANIGQALADLGRGNEGLAPLARARAIWRAMGDRREVWSLWHLSRAQATIGLTEEALGSYRELLTFGRRIGDRGIEIEALTGIARLQEKRGDLEEARSRAEEALAIIESSRGAIQIEALRSLYTASRQAAYDVYADVLAALDETQQDHRFAEAAFAATERGRARALTEAIAEARLDLAGDLLPDLRKRELELSARLASLQNKAALAGGNRASVEEPLAEAEEEWDRLITEIRRATPRYASVQYPEPISADAVKALLDSTTALVSYSVRAARTLVFVVTHDRLELHRLPVSAPSLAERVENYVGLISRDDREPWSSLAAGLHADLVAPWRGRLPPAIRRLIIVPDGALHSLPFETLAPARLGAHRLVEDFAISYAPSATVLAQLETPRARSMRELAAALLVLASPPVPQAIEQARGEIDGETFDLRPLSFAADEAKASLSLRRGGQRDPARQGGERKARPRSGHGSIRGDPLRHARPAQPDSALSIGAPSRG